MTLSIKHEQKHETKCVTQVSQLSHVCASKLVCARLRACNLINFKVYKKLKSFRTRGAGFYKLFFVKKGFFHSQYKDSKSYKRTKKLYSTIFLEFKYLIIYLIYRNFSLVFYFCNYFLGKSGNIVCCQKQKYSMQ